MISLPSDIISHILVTLSVREIFKLKVTSKILQREINKKLRNIAFLKTWNINNYYINLDHIIASEFFLEQKILFYYSVSNDIYKAIMQCSTNRFEINKILEFLPLNFFDCNSNEDEKLNRSRMSCIFKEVEANNIGDIRSKMLLRNDKMIFIKDTGEKYSQIHYMFAIKNGQIRSYLFDIKSGSRKDARYNLARSYIYG
jgi:hypothetical protein